MAACISTLALCPHAITLARYSVHGGVSGPTMRLEAPCFGFWSHLVRSEDQMWAGRASLRQRKRHQDVDLRPVVQTELHLQAELI